MATRRQVLSSAIASALSGAGLVSHAQAADDTLTGAYSRNKLAFGSAIRIHDMLQDHAFRDLALRECGGFTPEVEMKWDDVERTPGSFDFAAMDALVHFAQINRKRLYGHTLLWHLSVPRWAPPLLLGKDGWKFLQRYLQAVFSRYGHAIDQWNVVNEPIDVGRRMDGLRDSIFLQAFGADYIGRALREARRLAPGAKLMINEFGLEYDSTIESDRRYHFLKLLARLKGEGVPLDGIGLQAHLDLSKGNLAVDALGRFLKEIEDLGLFILITELDVKEEQYILPVAERDQLVADETRRYLDIVLAQPAVRGLTTWGLSDRQSWLEVTPEDLARYPGAWKDGTTPGVNRGLPFDSSLKPKPMYQAIMKAARRGR